jgi:hypothetical protein
MCRNHNLRPGCGTNGRPVSTLPYLSNLANVPIVLSQRNTLGQILKHIPACKSEKWN